MRFVQNCFVQDMKKQNISTAKEPACKWEIQTRVLHLNGVCHAKCFPSAVTLNLMQIEMLASYFHKQHRRYLPISTWTVFVTNVAPHASNDLAEILVLSLLSLITTLISEGGFFLKLLCPRYVSVKDPPERCL